MCLEARKSKHQKGFGKNPTDHYCESVKIVVSRKNKTPETAISDSTAETAICFHSGTLDWHGLGWHGFNSCFFILLSIYLFNYLFIYCIIYLLFIYLLI